MNVAKPLEINNDKKPNVVLVVGVNGTGKTTTIGKLAHQYSKLNKKIIIAACDTFRAAAARRGAVRRRRRSERRALHAAA